MGIVAGTSSLDEKKKKKKILMERMMFKDEWKDRMCKSRGFNSQKKMVHLGLKNRIKKLGNCISVATFVDPPSTHQTNFLFIHKYYNLAHDFKWPVCFFFKTLGDAHFTAHASWLTTKIHKNKTKLKISYILCLDHMFQLFRTTLDAPLSFGYWLPTLIRQDHLFLWWFLF